MVLRHKMIAVGMALLIGLMAVFAGCKPAEDVRFTSGAWSGDWITIYVPKIILEEEFGYTAEIFDSSVPAAWLAIATGEADLWTNSWQPNQENLKKKYSDTTVSLGTIYSDNLLQGWFVPKWFSEKYNVTSVNDLKDPEIAKLFDLDNDGVGDLLGGDASWKCAEINDQKIEAYGLGDLYEQKYGSETIMTVAIEGRMKKSEPVLFYFYTPHPFLVRYPIGESIVVLEDPKDFWPMAEVYKFANKEWVENNPQAAELLRQVKMTQADISWSMAEIEKRGDDVQTLESIAREWMDQRQSEIEAWIAAAKAISK